MIDHQPLLVPSTGLQRGLARARATIENGSSYSTITACILLVFGVMLLIDLWANPTDLSPSIVALGAVIVAGSGLAGAIVAVRMGPKLPRWVGLTIVTSQFAITTFTVAFTSDPAMVIGNIQGLPILALYLGCFYQPKIARLTAAAGVGAVAITAIWGPSNDHAFGVGLRSGPELVRLVMFVFLCVELGRFWRQRVDMHSMIDDLTGAFTRRAMTAVGDREISRTLRYNLPMTIALVDLDEFKCVNDTEGHTVGDEVLRAVVSQWLTSIRKQDTVYRLGGDEFVFFLPNTTASDAQILLTRLRASATHPWSWGVTEIIDGDTVATAVLRADRAMYTAKRSREEQHGREEQPR